MGENTVATENDLVVWLQATSFNSFCYEQKRNVIEVGGRPTPDSKLVG